MFTKTAASAFFFFFTTLAVAQSPDVIVDRVMGNAKFKAAQEFIEKEHDRIVREAGDDDVLMERVGSGAGPLIAVSASRGVMLTMFQAMDAAKIHTKADILFLPHMGSEELKYLLTGPYQDKIDMFISLEGPDTATIINSAIDGEGLPVGSTAIGSTIVQTASAAVRAFGLSPSYKTGMSDSNIPMSMHMHAITIGSDGSVKGMYIALATLLALASIQ